LTAYCERRGVTRDAAVERAIRLLVADEPAMRETVNRETGLPDFGLPGDRETAGPSHDHDDHDDKIIMIFERETGRRFRADERSLVGEFRDVDPAVVADAIRYAVKYSREPVGSFAYCAKVIRQHMQRPKARPEATTNDAPAGAPADDEQLRFEIRTAAARLREARRDDATYTHDRIVVDVRSGFVAQGRDVTVDQIEDALRGLAL
jgi:hypothetical protein